MDIHMFANDAGEDMRLFKAYSPFDPKSEDYNPNTDTDSPEAQKLRDEIMARCGNNTSEVNLWLQEMRARIPRADAKVPGWHPSSGKFKQYKA